MNVPKSSKKSALSLGISDKVLAGAIKQDTGIECASDENILELIRGIRLHCSKMLKDLRDGDFEKAQLGLGHSYSRCKVKFNVNRVDNMIIQSIALIDQLDKDINTFAMRVREWYSWHFPELAKLVSDHRQFSKLTILIKNKSNLSEKDLIEISDIVGSQETAKLILEASKSSMGTDISEIDLMNIKNFAQKVINLSNYREKLHKYLCDKMDVVAPNLAALIGEMVGARLISHAGSLTNLAKYPASTVQILGAEKALFRALKTKGKTPKYGLIYHSSFIGRAGAKNKGRVSRFLANKCSIASRLDCFNETPTRLFGEALKTQVDDRLKFYEEGIVPEKNIIVMQNVAKSMAPSGDSIEKKKKKKEKSK
jgi:nucleolar protein 56